MPYCGGCVSCVVQAHEQSWFSPWGLQSDSNAQIIQVAPKIAMTPEITRHQRLTTFFIHFHVHVGDGLAELHILTFHVIPDLSTAAEDIPRSPKLPMRTCFHAMSAYSTIQLIVLLICSEAIFGVTASPSQILPRKSTSEDPYIVCDDPPPVSSLPSNYIREWYPTTLDLCSALNGAARNLGCVWFVTPPPALPSHLTLQCYELHFAKPPTNHQTATLQPACCTATNRSPTRTSGTSKSPASFDRI